MRRNIHKKLLSRSGETLAEVLVALLIIVLSGMMLAGMISAAAGINLASRSRDETFYKDLSLAEMQTEPLSPPAGADSDVIIISDITGVEAQELQRIDVTAFGGSGLTSYEKTTEEPEP